MKTIKWGIIGTGAIAHTFAADINHVEGCTIEAVASRSSEKAEDFANDYGVKKYYGTYEALAEDPEIDVVYIATPHVFHKENSIMCMKHKKAVMCEKPIGVNKAELEEMIEVAKEEHVFLMEGMWTRFKPTIQKLRELLAQKVIGDIRYMKSDFGYMIDDHHDPKQRILNKALGGGSLLDVGVYPIAMTLMVMGALPIEITSKLLIGATDVDMQMMGIFTYPNEVGAYIHSAINTHTRWETYIIGTKGSIYIPNNWFGNQLVLTDADGQKQTFEFELFGSDYTHEITAVNQALRDGQLEHSWMSHKDSLDIMTVVDQISKNKS